MEKKYRINPSVFYRKYDKTVILYNTAKKKIYEFNEIVFDILSCFDDECSVDDAIGKLSKLYNISESQEEKGQIILFIESLVEENILFPMFLPKETEIDIEKSIKASVLEANQLFSVLFELTYCCNEKCRHCYVVNEKKRELSTEEVFQILDQLNELNVLNIIFTGGEIFTRKDIFPILRYAYEKGFVVDLFTNGTLLDAEKIIELKSVYPRSIQMSLYSHIPEKHDAVTCVKGSFEKTLKSIKTCSAVGLPVNIKTPIFQETVDDIREMTKLAASVGASIELGSNITPRKNGDLNPTKMSILGTGYEKEVRDIINEATFREDTLVIENKPEYLCGAGIHSASINPYGDVFPCSLLQLKAGNLLEESLEEIWYNSEKIKWWRENNLKSKKEECKGCEMFEHCIFCPGEALMRKGSPFAKYQEACLTTYNAYSEN